MMWLRLLAAAVLLAPLSCFVPGNSDLPDAGGDADDLCAFVVCDDGEVCIAGICTPDETVAECAADIDCADGWVCQVGSCTPEITPVDDACVGVTCPDGEQCVDGTCTIVDPPASCTTDDDCEGDDVCDEGVCAEPPPPATELEAENPGVAFAALNVGETYALVTPAPEGSVIDEDDADNSDEVVDPAPDDQTNDPLTPAEHTDSRQDDDPKRFPVVGGASPAARPAPEDCVCQWAVIPSTAAQFTDPDTCSTELSPLEAGVFTVAVSVACGQTTAEFTAPAKASEPPTTCTDHGDCDEDEYCREGVCAERSGPVVTILEDRSRSPFLVVLDLRLEDAQGRPIHEDVTRDDFRIYENAQEIDYAETGYAATPAPNLPLRVVVVLDYTVSMSNARAIGPMVSAARTFVQGEHFTATHQVGVVEFHDRTGEGAGYSVVSPLTRADSEGKAIVAAAIPAEGAFEPGMSRAWDAVKLALTMLGETERQPGEERAIVFLTDGRDTTSETLPETIQAAAVTDDVKLYPIGFGDPGPDAALLQSMADTSGGVYFPADFASSLAEVFADVADDLQGQWTLSYIAQRNTGTVTSRVEFDWLGATAAVETDINVAGLDGNIHTVALEVADRMYEQSADRTSFVLRAAYVPRNVWRFRFYVAQDNSELTLQSDGGLTSPDNGWVLLAEEGTHELMGSAPLDYGSFGNIGVVTLPGDVEQLQIVHDDSIYESLAQPKTVAFEGEPFLAPARLSVSVDPPDGGAVTIAPEKLAYARGEEVLLVAGALGDHVFQGWEGDTSGADYAVSVTMDQDKAVTARFYPPRTLTVTVDPIGSGTVTVNPDRTTYRNGELVVLTAVPGGGKDFSAWSGGVTGSTSSVTIVLDGDKTVTATFADVVVDEGGG